MLPSIENPLHDHAPRIGGAQQYDDTPRSEVSVRSDARRAKHLCSGVCGLHIRAEKSAPEMQRHAA